MQYNSFLLTFDCLAKLSESHTSMQDRIIVLLCKTLLGIYYLGSGFINSAPLNRAKMVSTNIIQFGIHVNTVAIVEQFRILFRKKYNDSVIG